MRSAFSLIKSNEDISQCFGKKGKKTNPEEGGHIPVQHEPNFNSNKNNISRVGNAYIGSDSVIVSDRSLVLRFTIGDHFLV